ncbi:TetR/AcrR family transcriptional regulator [Gordonia rubripertincta]|uniref:TetR/AcrR family transcriptional regulator n=1 Tax=Gordonia rubripertincta TaxID=36822 RepID=A0ABT4N1I9_GORRU|nr:TetR/AcrR family transcriptional regulator [Gordonia rubripertincta]MCZ4553143.1 TetR/AcrR family transcriptional regulator [Gordonia rubripertincta]
MGARISTKQRMLVSAVELLQERGAAGVTIDAVLSRSNAPRGSVYYHFPGGRDQIMTEAVDLAGLAIGSILDRSVGDGPVAILHRIAAFWTKSLENSGYRAGCPVASVAISGGPDEEHLHSAVAQIFQNWHDAITNAMVREGIADERAARLASMFVAAIEGAVILCRARRSASPLDDVVVELEDMYVAAAGAAGTT